jgi:hypothetical protein
MAGRPTKYSQEMQDAADAYIKDYAEHGHPLPSVVGMAVVLGVASSSVKLWGEKYPEFSATLEACKDSQHITLLHKGLTNDFNATITKLALSNHGYSESTKTDITSGGKTIKNDWHIHPVTTK